MQQAFQAGKVSFNPSGGSVNLIFADYAQPGDRMTLTFDTAAKKITSLSVNTYMGQAKDAVTLQVRMASLPEGRQLRAANSPQRQRQTACCNHDQFQLSEALRGSDESLDAMIFLCAILVRQEQQ